MRSFCNIVLVLLVATACGSTPEIRVEIVELSAEEEWVEVWNRGEEAVNLAELSLVKGKTCDGGGESLQEVTSLPAGERVVLYRALHHSLSFPRNGGSAALCRGDTLLSSLQWPKLFHGQTYGLLPSGTGTGVLRPTAGEPNEEIPRFKNVEGVGSPSLSLGTEGVCDGANEAHGTVTCRDGRVSAEDFRFLTVEDSGSADVERVGKFMVPARSDAALLPPLLQNANLFPIHREFLFSVFPERFPALSLEQYRELVMDPETRSYFTGSVVRLWDGRMGFSVVTDPLASSPALDPSDLTMVAEALTQLLGEEMEFVVPLTDAERQEFPSMDGVGLAVLNPYSKMDSGVEVYTPGIAYGTVRVLSLQELDARTKAGTLETTDILVLEEVPADLEAVVAAVVTLEPQSTLSHLTVRTARRGTPNLYDPDGMVRFEGFDNELVRLEVYEEGYLVVGDVSVEEAEEFWSGSTPVASVPVDLELDFATLEPLEDVPVENAEERERSLLRTGAKGTNLALLNRFGAPPSPVSGFLIPFHWYERFLDENRAGTGSESLTYRQILEDLVGDDRFLDENWRGEQLEAFQELARRDGVLPEGLDKLLLAQLKGSFGSALVMVRFRSSSNAEDSILFSGAGLYDSFSVCPADSVDEEVNIPSLCDPNTGMERTLRRGLIGVWTSLWNPRAVTEREYYSIPQDEVSMAVLVNRRFQHELANGVLTVGQREDEGYEIHVSAQWGEIPVVRTEPGVLPEELLLQGDKEGDWTVQRLGQSTFMRAGEVVLTDSHAQRLGDAGAALYRGFKEEGLVPESQHWLLEVEFKLTEDGELVFKQVRPLEESVAPVPEGFVISTTPGTALCTTFLDDRPVEDELSLRTRLELNPVQLHLGLSGESYPMDVDWIRRGVMGPDQTELLPSGPGILTLEVTHGETDLYRLHFEQSLAGGGETIQVKLDLALDAPAGGEPLGRFVGVDGDFDGFRGCVGECIGPMSGLSFDSCEMSSLPLFEHRFDLDKGPFTTIQVRMRHQPRPVDSGRVRLRSAIFSSVDGGSVVEADFFDQAYATRRHNESEDFLLRAPGGSGWVRIDEPGLLESPVVRVELLDDAFEVLQSFATASYDKYELEQE